MVRAAGGGDQGSGAGGGDQRAEGTIQGPMRVEG